MSRTKIIANYYQQFDLDYSLDVHAEGFKGWTRGEIEMDFDRTALIVMHAWDNGTPETNPRGYRCQEYLSRANKILTTVFPMLLLAVRASKLNIFHLAAGWKDTKYKKHPNYLAAVDLAGPNPNSSPERMEPDYLFDLHSRSILTAGAHNVNWPRFDRHFAPETIPQGEEPIAENDHQLFALCKKNNINHLIYAGFAVNECMMFGSGGMRQMYARNILCSTIRQATTAIENKESARLELHKEAELWKVSMTTGFVFDLDDFLDALRRRDKK